MGGGACPFIGETIETQRMKMTWMRAHLEIVEKVGT